MREIVRRAVNGVLAKAGLRVVSADWGPRGFADALARIKRAGIVPQQVVDIGAARGEWATECMTVFPDARYFLVDPLQENQAALKRVAAGASPPGRITVWHGALGAAEGGFEIRVHGDQSSFLTSEYAAGATTRKVPVRTLDSFGGTDLLPVNPGLIKADVQGYELEVLRGADRALAAAELLLLEVSFRRVYAGSPLAHDVLSFAASRGFRVYDICSYAQRPRDHELTQADILFAKETSRLFEFEGYA